MFLLVRRLKLGEWAAVVSGICFGLGGFVQQVTWPNILDAAPWLPLIVLFLLRAFDEQHFSRRIFQAGFAGVALGMTFLAGGLHVAMMDTIVIVTLAGYVGFVKEVSPPWKGGEPPMSGANASPTGRSNQEKAAGGQSRETCSVSDPLPLRGRPPLQGGLEFGHLRTSSL